MSLLRNPSHEELKRAPKAVLHDHLDGALRISTIIDISKEIGYTALPSYEPDELNSWFAQAANSGSLVKYLETFEHTVAVMQTRAHLIRVAKESTLDLALDNVVYAEVRYAPELMVKGGLSMAEVVEAVQEGNRLGELEAAALGYPITVRTILTALRHLKNGEETAALVVKYRDQGVVGFDIAGPEDGYPPSDFLSSFNYLRKENAHFTIHAGEAFGLPSIWEAIQICGAERLGHGVRIVDDIHDGRLGALAAYVRDRRIPLEMCPSSNVQTGAVSSIASHPIGLLEELRFRVTINTDNRLMSQTSMTEEFIKVADTFNWKLLDFQRVTVNALKSAFIPFDQRLQLIEDVVKPRYAAL